MRLHIVIATFISPEIIRTAPTPTFDVNMRYMAIGERGLPGVITCRRLRIFR